MKVKLVKRPCIAGCLHCAYDKYDQCPIIGDERDPNKWPCVVENIIFVEETDELADTDKQ